MIEQIPFTLDILPFLFMAAFIISVSFLIVTLSNVSVRIKLMLPMLGVIVLLLHLFWISTVIGRPIQGFPKFEFNYLHHRTTYIDQKAYTEIWIKDKTTDNSFLYRFPRDPKTDKQLQKVQREQKKGGRPRSFQFRNRPRTLERELEEILTLPQNPKFGKEPPGQSIENWDGTM